MAANDRVGNVYLDVLPRGEGFGRNVQSIIDKAERDANFLVNANTGPAQKQVQQLARQIEEDVGGSWQKAALQAAAFTAAVVGTKAAVQGVIGKFAELFDGLAKAKAGFDSILGDREGSRLLDQVRQFAIDSPFVTGEVVNYSQQLLGVGKAANTIVPTLQSVGDIVASVGGDTSNLGGILYALTQIQTIGKLTGQDARQLQNQLVPITRYIAQYLKVSVAEVKKLQEAGGVGSEVVFAAIEAQGKKVEGALNDSVRTIAGAKSVLSDTLRNFVQSSPGFNAIYEDLVQGIQNVAAALADPIVKGAIEDTLESVGALYESLKPLIEGLTQIAASGGLSALGLIARVLGVLADVIDAFPESVLRTIGFALGALAAVKAPLALIQYAQNISRLASGLLGTGGLVGGLTGATTATMKQTAVTEQSFLATNRARAAMAAYGTQLNITAQQSAFLQSEFTKMNATTSLASRTAASARANAKVIGGVAATAVGGIISANADQENIAAQTVGSALTYGGIGLSIGGPVGGAVGLAVGAIKGFLDSSDAELEAQIEKNRELGRKAAEAYLKENERLFSTATPAATRKITEDLELLNARLKDIQATQTGFTSIFDAAKTIQEGKELVGELEPQLKQQNDLYDKYIRPLQDAAFAAEKAGVGSAFFDPAEFTGTYTKSVKSVEDLDAAFRKYGLTSLEVINLGKEGFVELVTTLENLDTVQQKVTFSAIALATAYKESAADSLAIYGSQIANIGTQLATINSLEAAKRASSAAVGNTNVALDLTAKEALLKAQSAARTEATAQSIIATDEAITQAQKDGNTALEQNLILRKDKIAVAAGNAAADAVELEVLESITGALSRNTLARLANARAITEGAEARALTLLKSEASAISSQAGAVSAATQSGFSPDDRSLQLAAEIAANDAILAAETLASSQATAELRSTMDALLAAGVARDSGTIKALEGLIRITGAYAEAGVAAKTLADIERLSAEARQGYNLEAIAFLAKLQEGSQLAARIYGDVTAVSSAELDRINAITSAGSAIAAIIQDSGTATEQATLKVEAGTAAQTQYAAVFAQSGSAVQAAAAAQLIYNEIISAAEADISATVGQVVALNINLDSLSGRNAVVTVSVQGIEESLAAIAALQVEKARLISGEGTTFAGVKAINDQIAAEQRLIDIRSGKIPDDQGVFAADAIVAQALIQSELDAEAERKRKEAQAEADRLAKEALAEAERIAREAEQALERWVQSVEQATENLTARLEASAEAIAAAAMQWVSSIKERTQYERAISPQALTRNAVRQANDLAEITSGIAELRARGVTQAVLDSLGIDSIADTRQVRKLVGSSDSDLAALSTAVGERNRRATSLAETEEQAAQRRTIRDAILEAADTLGVDFTKDQASSLVNQFNLTADMDPATITAFFLNVISGGKIG